MIIKWISLLFIFSIGPKLYFFILYLQLTHHTESVYQNLKYFLCQVNKTITSLVRQAQATDLIKMCKESNFPTASGLVQHAELNKNKI